MAQKRVERLSRGAGGRSPMAGVRGVPAQNLFFFSRPAGVKIYQMKKLKTIRRAQRSTWIVT